MARGKREGAPPRRSDHLPKTREASADCLGFARRLEVLLARNLRKVRRDEQTRSAGTYVESIVKGSTASPRGEAFLLHRNPAQTVTSCHVLTRIVAHRHAAGERRVN